jgi:DNA-binding transcriptional LysR family regulator
MSLNLSRLDLNLLRVLEALLIERSVSAAGELLGLSQPAVSNALRRLRSLTGDPLFVRTRHGMEPTPAALLLGEPVREGLATIRAGFARSASFEPGNARRTFTLLMNDVGASSFLPLVVRRLAEEAPRVDLVVQDRDLANYADALDSGAADLAVGRIMLSGAFRSRLVGTSPYVVVLSDSHPLLTRGRDRAPRLTMAAYLAAPHIVVSPRGATENPVERKLAALGHRRRIALSLPHISALAAILPGSDLIATVPDRCVLTIIRGLPLAWVPLPFQLPANEVRQWWHPRHDLDPGHAWLRGLFARSRPRWWCRSGRARGA